ncbi:hypothetical protein DXX93_14480 [Thalassotalea euphylliae]|uniref:DUF1439 domain-containing protein n=1 Tax=Thalassotalea euphylliae TaxID=1655234 RepID=A0A3E0TUM0_9GAMM|nr:hypothetical protein [Thalassotalea euphylliae]REL27642.1 hypothetical protein DXX93_14480 [Thalassotalea euphylliae]
MQEQQTHWQKCKLYFTRLAIKLAMRFKWLKAARYSQDELNELLAANFPQTIPLPIANSQGELTILNAELTMPLAQDKLHIQLFCAMSIRVAQRDIYRAHLVATGSVLPYFDTQERVIRIRDMQLAEIRLVNDDYAFIGSTTDLVTLFMPKPFKYLLLSTVQLTFSLLKGVVPNELLSYLSLYSSGSKQRVLDYHKPEIENILIDKVEQEDWFYELDESDFEEQIFAEYGQHIAVEDGHLVFKFHLD